MICRLFEYEFDIGKKSEKDLVKAKDCPGCIEGTHICENLNTKKTKSKYSWTISRRLTFPEGYGDELVAIKLIHPSADEFWIVKKIVEGSYIFQVYVVNNKKANFGAVSLGELNFKLKEQLQFDGQEVVFEDFG